MNRRNFLNKSTFAIGASSIGLRHLVGTENSTQTELYIGKSGIYYADEYFVVGGLLSTDPTSDESALVNQRSLDSFSSEFSYSNNDKYKRQFGLRALELFAQSPSLKLIIKNIPTTQSNSLAAPSYLGKVSTEVSAIQEIITETGYNAQSLKVLKKPEHAFGSGITFFNTFSQQSSYTIEDKPFWESNLLQVASFLTSLIRASLGGHDINNINTTLRDHLLQRLQVSTLTQEIANKLVFL